MWTADTADEGEAVAMAVADSTEEPIVAITTADTVGTVGIEATEGEEAKASLRDRPRQVQLLRSPRPRVAFTHLGIFNDGLGQRLARYGCSCLPGFVYQRRNMGRER